jgi:predicted translin family RNA/ssDNA-binding protein
MSENLTIKELMLKMEAELKEDIEKVEKSFNDKLDEVKKSVDKMWTEVDKLKNRLPNWAVVLISTLTALLGFFIKAE